MIIAGETSGDWLAAELVNALREELTDAEAIPTWDYQPLQTGLEPRFFGAGGPRMAAAGVELAVDMTAHAVIGFSDALKNYVKFRRMFHQLYRLALQREPDAIICVDFAYFNRRFAHAIRRHIAPRRDWFHDWTPKIVQYVSPQVWASREARAYEIARDYDLLLSIFPFEKAWYARRVPRFHVEWVGLPLLDRYARSASPGAKTEPGAPRLLLLPGSRPKELERHLPPILGAQEILRQSLPELRTLMVLPDEALVRQAKACGLPASMELQTGGLGEALGQADVAIASTGTVTLECALFEVPTVAIYKTSWSSYVIAKRIARVKYIAMPNILAKEEILPEFIQHEATPGNIAKAALALLQDPARRGAIQAKLRGVINGLGGRGASRRAARAIVQLLKGASIEAEAVGVS